MCTETLIFIFISIIIFTFIFITFVCKSQTQEDDELETDIGPKSPIWVVVVQFISLIVGERTKIQVYLRI